MRLNRTQGPSWTTDSVERLTKLWTDGATARQIAIELGVSRNSVIGKVHRLGLPGRPKQRMNPARSPRRRMRSAGRRTDVAAGTKRIRSPILTPEPAIDIPEGQRIHSVLDLWDGRCRWPVGDPLAPDFYFCGGRTTGGKPYCGHHAVVSRDGAPWQTGPAAEGE